MTIRKKNSVYCWQNQVLITIHDDFNEELNSDFAEQIIDLKWSSLTTSTPLSSHFSLSSFFFYFVFFKIYCLNKQKWKRVVRNKGYLFYITVVQYLIRIYCTIHDTLGHIKAKIANWPNQLPPNFINQVLHALTTFIKPPHVANSVVHPPFPNILTIPEKKNTL
jgi:hypothetical protein